MAKITLEELKEMFAELREEGEWNLDEPLPWGYFFTSHETEKLERAAEALTEQGYTLVGIFDAEDSVFLHVEKTEHHTPESMFARNEELNAVAEKFGLDSYEGMDLASEVDEFDEDEEPIENPELLAVLEAIEDEPTPEQRETLTEELQSAVFLIPVANEDEVPVEGEDTDEGAAINLVICTDDEGAEFMPLFTDEAALRAWTDEPVAAVPMASAEAWEFILAQEDCSGAVINPGGVSFPLDRDILKFLNEAAE